MDKQGLIEFLHKEADEALKDLFPKILFYLEKHYVIDSKVEVPLYVLEPGWRRKYPENIMVVILNEAVKRLEQLGYTAHSYYNAETNPCLEVS